MKYDGNTHFTVSSLGIDIDLGWGYGIFILLLLVGFSNAVNLTDGLDGLAGGLSAISFVAFALISLFIGQEDMGIFCFILVGTIAGFLMFNAYPARIFMGDTGSLALGRVLATIAILTRREITLHTRILVPVNSFKHKVFLDSNKDKYLMTTVGKLIFNEILPDSFPYINEPTDENIEKCTPSKYFIA